MSAVRICLALTLAGCASACRAQRELVIITTPPGAEIRLDGNLLEARTPARIPFNHYGVRRITLYLDGYLSYSEPFDVRPPWYGRFPLDIVSEILIPVGWRDRHKLKVELQPGDSVIEAPDLAGVLQRAEELRRAGPDGPRVTEKPARQLQRDNSKTSEPLPPITPEVPPKPEAQGGSGGGGGR